MKCIWVSMFWFCIQTRKHAYKHETFHAIVVSQSIALGTLGSLVMVYTASYIACTFTFTFIRRFYPKRLTLHSSHSFYILSALAFPGNRTHDLGVANAMLYQLSYRKAHVNTYTNKCQNYNLMFWNCLSHWHNLYLCWPRKSRIV